VGDVVSVQESGPDAGARLQLESQSSHGASAGSAGNRPGLFSVALVRLAITTAPGLAEKLARVGAEAMDCRLIVDRYGDNSCCKRHAGMDSAAYYRRGA